MEMPYEIILVIIAVIIELTVGGIAVYFIGGRNSAFLLDESVKQEFEEERIRFQTELKHAGQILAESKTHTSEKDRRIENLSIAGERLQMLTETINRVTKNWLSRKYGKCRQLHQKMQDAFGKTIDQLKNGRESHWTSKKLKALGIKPYKAIPTSTTGFYNVIDN